jgi:hypothetical protein
MSDIVDEYAVLHVKAEGAKHSVSSCWLESEAEAVSHE